MNYASCKRLAQHLFFVPGLAAVAGPGQPGRAGAKRAPRGRHSHPHRRHPALCLHRTRTTQSCGHPVRRRQRRLADQRQRWLRWAWRQLPRAHAPAVCRRRPGRRGHRCAVRQTVAALPLRQPPTARARRRCAAVIAWLKQQAPVPVWLVGTSRGTQSAAYIATEATPAQGGPDGIVLTSTILTEKAAAPCPKCRSRN
jgi:hypothetical protein